MYVPAGEAVSAAQGDLRSMAPSAACPRPGTTGAAVAAARPAALAAPAAVSRSSEIRDLRVGRQAEPRAEAGLQARPWVSARAHSNTHSHAF